MPTATDPLLKLILDSKALSVWNHTTGPVFWYAAGVPGPFYLNTELMIGREAAEKILAGIDAIIAEETAMPGRAARLQKLVMDAYGRNPDYQAVAQALAAKAQAEFADGSYAVISGGERRDWLFSIPLAAETGLPHVYLFKNGGIFRDRQGPSGEKALHVSDLINNAASYFDLWLPMLQKAGLDCAGTLTVNARGAAGVEKLEKAGCKVAVLNRVDLSFFRQLHEGGLIGGDVLEEITVYFASPRIWAERYLMDKPALFAVPGGDKKSPKRMRSFFRQDPWGLRRTYPEFFAQMAEVQA